MAVAGDEAEQRRGFRLAFGATDLSLERVWMGYFGIGGVSGLVEVQAYVYGALSLPPIERDLLAHALNEILDALGVSGCHAGYSQDLSREDEPGAGTH